MFLDSGLCEMPNANEREKTWVSYEQRDIAVDASSSSVHGQSPGSFFGVASALGNEIGDPDLLPKKAFVLKRPSFCTFHDSFSILVATLSSPHPPNGYRSIC